ncbi:up-regulator of cell proliferation-like [Pelobates cultripes]|uniref:Up-regulator of cell proliferation-like n=2 Tax=Pelobates cultripes TaxID=61616 RepID=A0AAD1SQU3_PELCU|nr:up-regulator of cell proliferation-like [Pelobates cultripes]
MSDRRTRNHLYTMKNLLGKPSPPRATQPPSQNGTGTVHPLCTGLEDSKTRFTGSRLSVFGDIGVKMSKKNDTICREMGLKWPSTSLTRVNTGDIWLVVPDYGARIIFALLIERLIARSYISCDTMRECGCASPAILVPEKTFKSQQILLQNVSLHDSSSLNPLDVLCVLLHCSDNFLQQEIVSKMSMCQFAVPLLLPSGGASYCIFMLWAMRDIVKRWRPQSLADCKGFMEENVVNIPMPTFSFVRMGKTKLSKSKILNQVLSPAQQNQDFFIHDNMQGGNTERKLSEGLVEMSWYFPSGSESSDIFPEPIAVTNLRGDLESNWTQFIFLTRVSSAVFIFTESIGEREFRMLSNCKSKDTKYYFIITPSTGKDVSKETRENVQKLISVLKLDIINIILKKNTDNDTALMKRIQSCIHFSLINNPKRTTMQNMEKQTNRLGIYVDENSEECKKAREHVLEITGEIKDVILYKKKTMTMDTQEYQSELIRQRISLHEQQHAHDLPKGIMLFINAIVYLSPTEKHYFLKWLKFELDSIARNNLSTLQAEYKEKCNNPQKNKDELNHLDQKISDSSLGIEHFLREMGQFYEAEYSLYSGKKNQEDKKQFTKLPKITADLLWGGFPLELIDGDASNIPLQWITDVLTELDTKTGGQCRMRVITVLGVQSTGKSTLLNTMFGLQFPVASGRCTRGAFMTLIKVKKDFQEDLGCDFILVIDTEGLKAPELASLEDSYEHDNELATLVIGLSDITIINMAMENTIEMKDILQIVIHAFLRMKEIGRKTKCQFVHQNVSDVSAHGKNARDRKKLLEQLDEMTNIAANMETKYAITTFSDIMDYDIENDNWYIPGLWHGVPPMAPVNSGYSENASALKKYLVECLKTCKPENKPLNIQEFITWMKSLWNAVKHEKFIFSFRNSLVAEAYNKMTIQFSQWEWDFNKAVHSWVINTETLIRNQSADRLDATTLSSYKDKLNKVLCEEERKMTELLRKYFENNLENAHLIEKYREDFSMSVIFLKKDLERNALSKFNEAVHIQKGKFEIQGIQNKYQKIIEDKVIALLKSCRERHHHLSVSEMEEQFDGMWKKTISDLQIEPLRRCNVSQAMLHQLRHNVSNKGSEINNELLKVNNLFEYGDMQFVMEKYYIDHNIFSLSQKVNTASDYDDTYCQELLRLIDGQLENKHSKKIHCSSIFKLHIKLLILGRAAQRFQKMHDNFIQENDTITCLEKLKPPYLATFLRIYQEKDQSKLRAKDFCDLCLKPALTEYIYKHLGQEIVDDVLGSSDNVIFKSRSFFQARILESILENGKFSDFVEYMNSYRKFLKNWIFKHILGKYMGSSQLETLQQNILLKIAKKIRDVLKQCLNSANITIFLKNICEELKNELVISQNQMHLIVFGNHVNVSQFSSYIKDFLSGTQKQILTEVKSLRVESTLFKVKLKPEDELLKKVIGCGKQCPFCNVPCEAGGADHTEHFASIHRPQGLGRYRYLHSEVLCTEICSTSVVSKESFRNADTDGEYHPYKEYRTFYPDWSIQPDPSIESTDYWKYVFAGYADYKYKRDGGSTVMKSTSGNHLNVHPFQLWIAVFRSLIHSSLCLKPALTQYIYKHLGKEIVDDCINSLDSIIFKNRPLFNVTVLENLLEKEIFEEYVKYINSYESFLKSWILKYISDKYRKSPGLQMLHSNLLSSVIERIKDVLKKEKCTDSPKMSNILKNICEELKSELVIPQNQMHMIGFGDNTNIKQFSADIETFLSETENQIQVEMSSLSVEFIISKVTLNPVDELLKKMIGCGKQCPFCKVPCEAGGLAHKHFASIHRPQGLGQYRHTSTHVLVKPICSTIVASEKTFEDINTNWKPHPCKEYCAIYPDWSIQPDPSIESTDYWKYVFVKFNEQFAELYNAKPAILPERWQNIDGSMVPSIRRAVQIGAPPGGVCWHLRKSCIEYTGRRKAHCHSKISRFGGTMRICSYLFEFVCGCSPRSAGEGGSQDFNYATEYRVAEKELSCYIHPLDVLCVLLHCSDHFVQQEIVSKLSMCQFAVPLLLPAANGTSCTFMLWAMRDIVKRWRPHLLAGSKGSMEENVVNIPMPTFSFVRLGKNKLSKSKIMNHILSPAQQHHDFFVHKNMDGGNTKKKVSDGLVEMFWYFPSGSKSSDIFPEPIAVTNLRGDLESNWTQFIFLNRVSSAVFIFTESIGEREFRMLSNCYNKDTKYYFIITPRSGKEEEKMVTIQNLKKLKPILEFENTNIIIKKKEDNDPTMAKHITCTIVQCLNRSPKRNTIQNMEKQINGLGIYVHEHSTECRTAREHAGKITEEIKNVVQYKNETMCLQGDLWKQISKIEKEMCRMKNQGAKDVEEYRCELISQRISLQEKQYAHDLPYGVTLFIKSIMSSSYSERRFFFKWMKIKLDDISRKSVSVLQDEYNLMCQKATKENKKELKELDWKISESSLEIEHFLREISQFYEAECSMLKEKKIHEKQRKFYNHPVMAADLLLDGFPFELFNGDNSNIPLQWITDVLTELDTKTGGQCRIRVITVLGVQSTGKSTLLNTMFGLQFPVASGRCTRGAFMTLIKVEDDFQEELGCDFILVIDTEGLKAPELASLEDSHEHDNELATLVVGLSDITIINLSMESTTEITDILQMVTHAFLRINQIGKKPNCQFVHQNVSAVSADQTTIRDKNKLLEQLDSMIITAASIEEKKDISEFRDVIDYDLEKDNWYIPSLWYGVLPMASVSSGYSEKVSDLKKHLCELIKSRKTVSNPPNIKEFIEWIRSLWNGVKHEKFIFSFRNSLVVEAYNKLTVKFSQWEWDFTKAVHTWLIDTETVIRNESANKLTSDAFTSSLNELQRVLNEEEKKMLQSVEKYFDNKTENIQLIEKYKEDFILSVKFLKNELERNAKKKYEEVFNIQKGKSKVQRIDKLCQEKIKKKVKELLKTCKMKKCQLNDIELTEAFETMWKETISNLQIETLKKCNVNKSFIHHLHRDMGKKGSKVNEKVLGMKTLEENAEIFLQLNRKLKECYMSSVNRNEIKFSQKHYEDETSQFLDSLIDLCNSYVAQVNTKRTDYHDTYCQELLRSIDNELHNEHSKKFHITALLELDIKCYLLGRAAPAFQEMHEKYIQENDMNIRLEKLKPSYLSTFLSVYIGLNPAKSKAREFCNLCLKPAVTEYIYRHLGKEIVDDIIKGCDNVIFNSRSHFHAAVMADLLEKETFAEYIEYIRSYESFLRKWLVKYLSDKYRKSKVLQTLQENSLSAIVLKIDNVLTNVSLLKSERSQDFLRNVLKELNSELIILQTDVINFENNADVSQFSGDIQKCLPEIKQQILSEVNCLDVQSILSKVTLNPVDEIMQKVKGCGKQCPFCKVPCEAGGFSHKHSASIHRPQGLGKYRNAATNVLAKSICSTYVASEATFHNKYTHGKDQPYKEYHKIYPDWSIQPDPSIESTDYWKYIFVKFNEQFATEYKAKPTEVAAKTTKEMEKAYTTRDRPRTLSRKIFKGSDKNESDSNTISNRTGLKPKSRYTPNFASFRHIELFLEAAKIEIEKISLKSLRIHSRENLLRREQRALKTLQDDADIIIKPADKGGNIVVMDVDQYLDMAKRVLKDTETYTILKHDPTDDFLSKYKEILEDGRSGGLLSDREKIFYEFLLKLSMEGCINTNISLKNILNNWQENLKGSGLQNIQDVPWRFLRQLLSFNVNARNTQYGESNMKSKVDHNKKLHSDDDDDEDEDLVQIFFTTGNAKKEQPCYINPLDVLCVLLHCSDNFVQQEIVSKLSLCQFAVPLLLPAANGTNCTFMLWAMRDIVKRWRPHLLAGSKGSMEGNLVNIPMSTFSFVRLGKTKLSKSKILNQVLSPTQQHHDFFIHKNMDGGNTNRKISNGLVEMSWYFPSGSKSLDIFPEPLAVTNLRGDLESNWTQFIFLSRISSAVFIFTESIGEREFRLLSNYYNKDTKYYFIITPRSGKEEEKMETIQNLKKLKPILEFENTSIIVIKKEDNDHTMAKHITSTIVQCLNCSPKRNTIQNMEKQMNGLGIYVHEHSTECHTAREHAGKITEEIKNVVQYKKETMCLQGDLWKQISKREKEMCRMKNQGKKDVEEYKCELISQRISLQEKQYAHDLPSGITLFINAIMSSSYSEKHTFLKWMKFNLDDISRRSVSVLQDEYNLMCQKATKENKEMLKKLDRKISESSLGIEHFLREISQFYEAECSMLKEKKCNEKQRKFSNFPGMAADLLLDGFPLELFNGDNSNIALQWITDVLTELDTKTGGQCRIRVITVLGVQSTGKSTLLNTMFGLQFPVASGRCTRGAFMTFIKLKDDFKEELGCDFILVIDAEGIKAPELASLEDSHEHDNELATLVVGLSDITIINMAMESTTEITDILQMVTHAFLRFNQIGKKPNCQFVHQNVSAVSADQTTIRDKKKLLEQLDSMIKTAAIIEEKKDISEFRDVIDYNLEKDNWYIPSLWYGVLPMASVSSGYSEKVSDLKNHLFELIRSRKTVSNPPNIKEFIEGIRSLWTAVKHEKFIFSFRNSLVVEAYNNLTVKFSEWEQEFTKAVHSWVIDTETLIRNQPANKLTSDAFTSSLNELQRVLTEEEKKMLQSVETYFDNKTENIQLIEIYKEDFILSVKFLKHELERNAKKKYEEAFSNQKGKSDIQRIENIRQETINKKVK